MFCFRPQKTYPEPCTPISDGPFRWTTLRRTSSRHNFHSFYSLGGPGFHTTARELQTCTFQGTGAPPKFHEWTPRERKERGGKKKTRNLGKASPFGAPPFLGWGPTPSTSHPRTPPSGGTQGQRNPRTPHKARRWRGERGAGGADALEPGREKEGGGREGRERERWREGGEEEKKIVQNTTRNEQ